MVERYDCEYSSTYHDSGMEKRENGDWVRFEDFKAIEAKLDALQTNFEVVQTQNAGLMEYARRTEPKLKATETRLHSALKFIDVFGAHWQDCQYNYGQQCSCGYEKTLSTLVSPEGNSGSNPDGETVKVGHNVASGIATPDSPPTAIEKRVDKLTAVGLFGPGSRTDIEVENLCSYCSRPKDPTCEWHNCPQKRESQCAFSARAAVDGPFHRCMLPDGHGGLHELSAVERHTPRTMPTGLCSAHRHPNYPKDCPICWPSE